MALTIRRMIRADYPAIVDLWNVAGLPYKPMGRDREEKIAAELAQPTALFFVAIADGRVVGSVFGTHDGRKGWINRLVVSPDAQRRGVAAALVRTVEEELVRIGIEIFACLIEEGNDRSFACFEKLGYRRHGDITYLSRRLRDDI